MAIEEPGYYDRQGQPISLEEFGRLSDDHAYRFLGIEFVGDRVVVSIWMGHDILFRSPENGAELFQTTVFRQTTEADRGIRFDKSGRRWVRDDAFEQRDYSTEAAAYTGHAELIELVRRMKQPD